MQIGFNNDVEFEGQRYHIQTEDLGLTAAKITSQIFQGGAIVDSISVPYSKEILTIEDEDARDEEIRKRMRALHKLCYRNINSHKYTPGASDEEASATPPEQLPQVEEPSQADDPPQLDQPNPQEEVPAADATSDLEADATPLDDVSDTSTTNRMQPEETPAVTDSGQTKSLPTVDGFTVAGEQAELGDEAVEAKSRGVQMELDSKSKASDSPKKAKKKKTRTTVSTPIAAFRGLDFTESPDLHEVLNSLLG